MTTDARRKEILPTRTIPAGKDFAMDTDLAPLLHPWRPRQNARSLPLLITCSVCLRVRRGSEWIEAEHVINEIRSYELDAPPRLKSAICDVCADSILSRRAREIEPIAA
jgi:hypothetical protein